MYNMAWRLDSVYAQHRSISGEDDVLVIMSMIGGWPLIANFKYDRLSKSLPPKNSS